MASMTQGSSVLEKLYAWIGDHEDARVGIVELYRDAPPALGMTEPQVRYAVHEGMREQRLALTGLVDTVQLVR